MVVTNETPPALDFVWILSSRAAKPGPRPMGGATLSVEVGTLARSNHAPYQWGEVSDAKLFVRRPTPLPFEFIE